VVLGLGAANRDERVFTDPERFDLDRDPAELRQSLSFGGGRHFGLGANLARLEARVVLRSLVRRCSSNEAEHPGAVRFYSANVRGFAHLPVTVTPR
jgi:cytochrome P450